MSVFVRIQQGVFPAQFFRLRGTVMECGVDDSGSLTITAPTTEFFALFRQGGGYGVRFDPRLLVALEPGEAASQLELPVGTLRDLHERLGKGDQSAQEMRVVVAGLVLKNQLYTFTLWPCSAESEVLANAAGAGTQTLPVMEQPAGYLCITFGQMADEVPLLPGLKYSIGSSPQNTVVLPEGSAQPHHCEAWLLDGNLVIAGKGGEVAVRIDDPPSKGPLVVTIPGEFYLNPPGLRLMVRSDKR